MSCEAHQDQLLSLAMEDGGAPEEAAAAREHLQTCQACRDQLARLEAGYHLAGRLPMEDPDPSMSDDIMAAARAKARGEAGAREARAPRSAGLSSVLDWLRGVALGPQVAMAMVMLLVVAMGVWYLPDLREGSAMRGEPVVQPDPQGEVAPSAAPAEAEEAPPGMAEREAEPAAPHEGDEQPARAAKEERADAPKPLRKRSRPAPARKPEAEAAAAPRAERQARAAPSSRSGTPGDPLLGLAEEAPAAAPVDADDEAAAEPPEDHADVLLARARAQRQAKDCRTATHTYEAFLLGHRKHASAPQAMLEVAECHERLGNRVRARHWLTQAAQHPSAADEASQRLERLQRAAE
jgi:hypothetical protein